MATDRPEILLSKAKDDLAMLMFSAEHQAATDEQFGFFCQQAIEKALKSVLGRHGIDYPWTHDLTRLLLFLDTANIGFPAELREADLYTSFAVQFRYEDLPERDASAKPFDRAHAQRLATSAVDWAGTFAG